jgi:hypothetical protein
MNGRVTVVERKPEQGAERDEQSDQGVDNRLIARSRGERGCGNERVCPVTCAATLCCPTAVTQRCAGALDHERAG